MVAVRTLLSKRKCTVYIIITLTVSLLKNLSSLYLVYLKRIVGR